MTDPKIEQRDRPPSPKCRCWKPSGPPQVDCPVHGRASPRPS